MAQLLYGAPVAAAICERAGSRLAQLKERGIVPGVAILRIGEDGGSAAYERSAIKRCTGLGIRAESVALPAEAGQEALLQEIDRINGREDIHGCLVMMPLPKGLDELAVRQALRPEKDLDCITPSSQSFVFSGRGPGFTPCTPQACLEILDHYGVPLKGARVAVIGRSLAVGRPLSLLLQNRDATVTMCHSGTRELAQICREQDIVISAAGRAGLVTGDFLRPGQVVLDVGTNVTSAGKLTGDVCFDEAESIVAAITPVPGGVGAVTTSVLAEHAVLAAEAFI